MLTVQIYDKLPMSLSTSLSQGQVLAVLRLLAHAKAAERNPALAKRGIEMAMVFVSCA